MSAQGSGTSPEFSENWFSKTPQSSADEILPLRAHLNRARSLYDEGAYRESIAEALRARGELADQPPDGFGRARIAASASALAGRASLKLGMEAEAAQHCRISLEQFGKWLPEDGVQIATTEELTDLGTSLYVCGEDTRAKDVLTQAVARGAADAETHRFLGLTLMRLGAFVDADQELMASLRIEPRDIATFQALLSCREHLPAKPEETAEVLFNLASAYYLAGRPEEALDACRKSVDMFPTGRAEAGIGIIEAERGKFDIALDAFERAQILEPSDTSLTFRKGEILRLLGRFDEALTTLSSVPESAGEYVHSLGSLGATLRSLGKHNEALAALDRALERQPAYPFALMQKAELLVEARLEDEAIELYKRAVEADASVISMRLRLVELLRGRGRFQEAVDVSNALLSEQPGQLEALAAKAAALVGLGKRDSAIEVADQALKLEPDFVPGRVIKGEALMGAMRLKEAIEEFRHALRLNPELDATRFLLAESLRLLGQYDESIVELDALLARNADNAAALGTKGQILASQGSREEGIALLERAVTIDPSLNWAYLSLGQNLQVTHRSKEAIVVFDKILERMPADVVTLGWKGDALLELGRYDEAVAALDRALDVEPENVFSMATKGQVLNAQGKSRDGLDLLTRAVEIDEEAARARGGSLAAPWAQFTLAEALRVAGRAEESLAVYDKVLAREPGRTDALGGKGAALMALERYEEAMPWLDSAIASAPVYDFGVSSKGALLLDCGEMEAAVDVLAPVTDGADASAWALLVRGFGLRVLGRYPEAEQLLSRSVELAPDLTARHLLADVNSYLGQHEKAKALYLEIVNGTSLDSEPDTLAILGWCRFGLEEFDTAVQCLVDAVSRGRKMAHAQFDLALALLCSHREDLAVREYERGLEMASKDHHPWRRRGLFKVALQDIAIAHGRYPHVADNARTEEVRSRLRAELERLPLVIFQVETAANETGADGVGHREAAS